MIKQGIKRVAISAAALVAPSIWRAARAPRLLVLMYHRVLPLDHADRQTEQPGMYVSPETLAMHLQVLRECGFVFVHLDEWLESESQGRPVPAQSCAITFDDGWRDNYQYAFPILQAARVPATIYLVADLIGSRYSFWPSRLARLLAQNSAATLLRMPGWLVETIHRTVPEASRKKIGAADIDAVITACKTRTDAEMLAVVDAIDGNVTSPGRDLMSWAEIEELQASGLVRFGSHTRRHTRLSGDLAADDLEDEVLGSRSDLEERLGTRPRTFCYPNGDAPAAAVALARTGYLGAVTTEKGWHRPGHDRHLIHRIGVHEDVSNRPAAFIARISGWL